MKTKFLLLAFIVLFAACGNEDVETDYQKTKGNQTLRLYGVKSVKDVMQTKGAAQKSKLWYPGTNIKIKFLDGTATMHEEVKAYAAEWLKYAGMGFEYVTEGKADVRITFDKDDDRYVTWSYTGTDFKYIPQSEATMNFSFWSDLTVDEKRGDVLRAYGQMLGLELEHRHIKLETTWGSRIESYWTSELGDIPWETLRECVFDPLSARDVIATQEYDAQSVMIWPFTLRGLVTYPEGYSVPKEYNTQLSEMDKIFIATLYPKPEEEYIFRMKVKATKDDAQYPFVYKTSEPLTINWGDGSEPEILEPNMENCIYKTYQKEGDYEIKIYGNREAIIELGGGDMAYLIAKEIDVSKCTKLKRLAIRVSGDVLTDLDISKNTELEDLSFESKALTKIDLSKNLKLKSLYTYGTSIYKLDVSNLTELEYLYCENNIIEDLILLNNSKLRCLMTDGNPFMNDENKVLNVINSLPDLSNATISGWYYSSHLTESHKNILNAKSWMIHSW